MNIILDACAVIAFFRNETGADLVRETITDQNNNKMIHVINLGEVYYNFYRDIRESETEKLIQELRNINIKTRFDLRGNFWRQVSKYKAVIKRISLADCFALTLANQEKGILVTSDRKEFEPIVPINICQIDFIR
ncbi:type II toxin-antitoxin system VapC family toxin [Microcystis aeruginosa]|uniref:type II toxin-antitoxin system VapC family toxin n=1 Tax=Microcystis aeruginosa TaxID=1126 RepID=UPI00232D9C3D|nr:type II toxin-antitoxin system VapC family toxin [Microcystis aeruginosa]MDB9412789.1 type II toxin-antitoxin system VapC family toxin [Microcystis aeruginosa CS-567/02]